MSSTDFEATIQQSHAALDKIVKGDPSAYLALLSRREEVTLGNPFGGFGRGIEQVVELIERAATYYRDGRATSFEMVKQVVTAELAYTVEIERFQTKVGGSPDLSELALRVTCIYRREPEGWKLVHRHADPRVSRQPARSVIQP
jgi:ketosteroid isomerase-like protein